VVASFTLLHVQTLWDDIPNGCGWHIRLPGLKCSFPHEEIQQILHL